MWRRRIRVEDSILYRALQIAEANNIGLHAQKDNSHPEINNL